MISKNYKPFKVNESPRISVNPLCEYVVEASASRRAAIIKRCKKPVAFITKWYTNAEDILSFYLSRIKDDPKILKVEATRLLQTKGLTDMEKKFNEASAESLMSFLNHHDEVKNLLNNYSIESAVNESKHKFLINGVQISLRPELLLRDEQNREQLGFIKFYFSKNEPLSQERGSLMASLTRIYFEQEHGFKFNGKNCFVLDVFAGKLYEAPKSYKRDLANIMAACSEIRDRWLSI